MKLTTLQHKLWMSGTGLFLCFFLIIHLLGNLQLLLPPDRAQEQFNRYSQLLSGNIIIEIVAYVLYASIIGHAVYAIIITVKNSKAAGAGYAYDKRGASSVWYSRNMGLLGTVIFLFLIIHFKDFWYQYKFTALPLDAAGNKDLYTIVEKAYQQLWYVALYEIALIALGFHLLHGFYSAARTLGVFHPKYVRWVKVAGWVYTAVITLGFMSMPIYIYLKNLL
ncbi:MAG: succinate dehydrogenase cytochrome b subunit [Chitinophagaceae bacterium]|jgi:succinate dehydrogenase / fumarate reductase cytochrome b subunit|nr:succinate dehydrogenase cytochrome b subunit [Chitinophagaceae bacterium]